MSIVSTGQYLIQLLELYSVDFVFGIPGVHTAELYRGLAASNIQHVTPRHEQGAGFMADGYARASGKPGVCLVITGPGLSNLSTAMLQARADSIPMLVISGVNNPHSGSARHLHEMPDQSAFARSVAISTTTINDPAELAAALATAYMSFESERPGPVHIEIPLAIMQMDCSHLVVPTHRSALESIVTPVLDSSLLRNAANCLKNSDKTIIIAGGGSRRCAKEILDLASRLHCPIVTTVNARALFPLHHPLHIAASPSLNAIRSIIESADTVLVIGSELGPTDFDMYETDLKPHISKLIHIDIAAKQLSPDSIGICAAAEVFVPALLEVLAEDSFKANEENATSEIVVTARQQASAELSVSYVAHLQLLNKIREGAEQTIFVGDSTQITYAGNLCFEPGNKGAWFNSSTGFGTLGYALPAAIGAKLAEPNKPVLAIVGDVGLQFTLTELGTLRDLNIPIVILLWNNNGSGEIRNYMIANDVETEGVDLPSPDFPAIATAYKISSCIVDHRKWGNSSEAQIIAEVSLLIERAFKDEKSLLIDIRVPE